MFYFFHKYSRTSELRPPLGNEGVHVSVTLKSSTSLKILCSSIFIKNMQSIEHKLANTEARAL